MDLLSELAKAGTDDTAWSEKTVKKMAVHFEPERSLLFQTASA